MPKKQTQQLAASTCSEASSRLLWRTAVRTVAAMRCSPKHVADVQVEYTSPHSNGTSLRSAQCTFNARSG